MGVPLAGCTISHFSNLGGTAQVQNETAAGSFKRTSFLKIDEFAFTASFGGAIREEQCSFSDVTSTPRITHETGGPVSVYYTDNNISSGLPAKTARHYKSLGDAPPGLFILDTDSELAQIKSARCPSCFQHLLHGALQCRAPKSGCWEQGACA